MAGCRAGEDRRLAEVPLAEVDVVAVFPPDGAPTTFGDVPVEVVLGATATGRLPTVTLTRGDATSDLACALAEGGTVADCGVVPSVATNEVLALSITAGETQLEVATLGRKPLEGLGWSLFDGMEFTTLGGGGVAAGLANDEIRGTGCFGALDGYDGTPGDWTLVAGPVTFEGPPDQPDRVWLGYPGFAFVLPVRVDPDGSVTGAADTAWLPLELQGEVVHVLMLDVALEATLVGEDLRGVRVSGQVPALGLEELVRPLGGLGAEVLDEIDLDVDRDGDGEADAATVVLEGTPAPATIW